MANINLEAQAKILSCLDDHHTIDLKAGPEYINFAYAVQVIDDCETSVEDLQAALNLMNEHYSEPFYIDEGDGGMSARSNQDLLVGKIEFEIGQRSPDLTEDDLEMVKAIQTLGWITEEQAGWLLDEYNEENA